MLAREIFLCAWAMPEAFGFDPPDDEPDDARACAVLIPAACAPPSSDPTPAPSPVIDETESPDDAASLCSGSYWQCDEKTSFCACEGRPYDGWCATCGAWVAGWSYDQWVWDLTWHRAFETLVRRRLAHFGAELDLRLGEADRVSVNWYEPLEERDRLCNEVLRIVSEVRVELREFGPELAADPPGADPAQLTFSWVA